MNILEALTLKKDLKERIEDLESRLTNSVTVLKGRKPIEDPQSLMTQLEDSSKQLNDICCRIKMANAMAKNDKGLTLVELVVKRSIEEKIWRFFEGYSGKLYMATEKFTIVTESQISNTM